MSPSSSKTEETALEKSSALDRFRGSIEDVSETNFEDLMNQLLEEGSVLAIDADYKLISRSEKEKLVGTPFIILKYKRQNGDFGTFYTMWCKTVTNENIIVNDGSKGVAAQLAVLDFDKEERAILVKNGLRASDYKFTTPDGKEIDARTYYLDPDPTGGRYKEVELIQG